MNASKSKELKQLKHEFLSKKVVTGVLTQQDSKQSKKQVTVRVAISVCVCMCARVTNINIPNTFVHVCNVYTTNTH